MVLRVVARGLQDAGDRLNQRPNSLNNRRSQQDLQHVKRRTSSALVLKSRIYDNAKICALEHSRTVVTFKEALLDFAGR